MLARSSSPAPNLLEWTTNPCCSATNAVTRETTVSMSSTTMLMSALRTIFRSMGAAASPLAAIASDDTCFAIAIDETSLSLTTLSTATSRTISTVCGWQPSAADIDKIPKMATTIHILAFSIILSSRMPSPYVRV